MFDLLYWRTICDSKGAIEATLEDIDSADCVLVQAFGRNNFPDRTLSDDILISKGLSCQKRIDALWRQEFDPGEPNRKLAEIVVKLWVRNPKLIVIAQWEVVYAIREIDSRLYDLLWENDSIECLWPPQKGYYNTVMVKKDSVKIMDEYELTKAIEVAHSCMIVRDHRILRKLGIESVMVPVDAGFDPNSVQPRTKSLKSWRFAEILVRIFCKLKRYT